jgi:hypothetical protein
MRQKLEAHSQRYTEHLEDTTPVFWLPPDAKDFSDAGIEVNRGGPPLRQRAGGLNHPESALPKILSLRQHLPPHLPAVSKNKKSITREVSFKTPLFFRLHDTD